MTPALTSSDISLIREAIRTHRFMLASALTTLDVGKENKKAREHMNQLAHVNEKLDRMAVLSLDTS